MINQWYEELFENYAKSYDIESYTQGTKGEVDFIEREIHSDKSKKILDVGIYGCRMGAFSREDRLRTDDFEMLVVADKAKRSGKSS